MFVTDVDSSSLEIHIPVVYRGIEHFSLNFFGEQFLKKYPNEVWTKLIPNIIR